MPAISSAVFKETLFKRSDVGGQDVNGMGIASTGGDHAELSKEEVMTTASIGISIYPEGGNEAHELLKTADLAMYQAKSAGKNNYVYYDAAIDGADLPLRQTNTK